MCLNDGSKHVVIFSPFKLSLDKLNYSGSAYRACHSLNYVNCKMKNNTANSESLEMSNLKFALAVFSSTGNRRK